MNRTLGRSLLALRYLTKLSPRIRGMGKIIPPIMRAGYQVPDPLRIRTIDDADGNLRMELALDDMVQSYVFWSPSGYDRHAVAVMKQHVKPGDVVLDLGANVGYYALIAAKLVGSRGTVVAVEPDPENFERLCRNIELNGFDHVVPVRKGIADAAAVLRLRRNTSGNRGAHSFAGTGDTDAVEVEVDTIDAIVSGLRLDRVDFIKVDIQGFEVRAFESSHIFRFKPIILTEIAEDELTLAGSSADQYKQLLRARDYDLQPIDRDPLNYLCIPHQR